MKIIVRYVLFILLGGGEIVAMGEHGYDLINAHDEHGMTCLHRLIKYAKPDAAESVRRLLDQGADSNIPDKDGRTALHYAAIKSIYLGAIYQLLLCGADQKIRDKWGKTAKDYFIHPDGVDSRAEAVLFFDMLYEKAVARALEHSGKAKERGARAAVKNKSAERCGEEDVLF